MVLVHGDSCSSGSWWWWCFESGVLRQHSIKCDADTFDDGQEDGATDGINTHGFGPASNRQCASSEEASDNGIPRIFLLPTKVSISTCLVVRRDLDSSLAREEPPHLMPFTAQSKLLKRPPHTPKLPPRTGARVFRATMAPTRRSPCGELLLKL